MALVPAEVRDVRERTAARPEGGWRKQYWGNVASNAKYGVITKFNPKMTTRAGMQAYARKHPGTEFGYSDITGPGGKPDGYPEAWVKSRSGKILYLNGQYPSKEEPMKRMYYTWAPTAAQRRRTPYSKFKQGVYEIEGFDAAGNPVYRVPLRGPFANVRKKPTPMRTFRSLIFKPIYDAEKRNMRGLTPMEKARVSTMACNYTYNSLVAQPVFTARHWGDIGIIDERVEQQHKRSAAFKQDAFEQIQGLQGNARAATAIRTAIRTAMRDV